jgi:hypothetical protein
VQKALLDLLKKRFEADPAETHGFALPTEWRRLDQLVTVFRLKELAKVRIVKRGGRGNLRIDVGEPAATFFGRQILEGVGLGARRRVVDRQEFEKIKAECAKIKLTLPEAVEPTTTEKFFA